MAQIVFETLTSKSLFSYLDTFIDNNGNYVTFGNGSIKNLDRYSDDITYSNKGFVPLINVFDEDVRTLNSTRVVGMRERFLYGKILNTYAYCSEQNFSKFPEYFTRHSSEIVPHKYTLNGETIYFGVGPGIVVDKETSDILFLITISEEVALRACKETNVDITSGEQVRMYMSNRLYLKRYEKLLKTLNQLCVEDLIKHGSELFIMFSQNIKKEVFEKGAVREMFELVKETEEMASEENLATEKTEEDFLWDEIVELFGEGIFGTPEDNSVN